MIYLVYPLLGLALFWGAKFSKKKEFNDEAFSQHQMKMMQGFAAVCVLLHHCGQKTSASWINKIYYHPGLEPFVPIGYVLVSLFMFCSGFGLYKSFKNKPNYLGGKFLWKRVLYIFLVGYVISLLFLGERYLLNEKIGGKKLFWYLSCMKLANPNGWYVLIVPFFFLAFFLAFRFIKNEKIAFLAVLIFTLAYQFMGASIDHNDWWMRGEWWYNSALPFPIGILIAMNEEKFVAHLKRNYIKYLIIGIVALVVFNFVRIFNLSFFSYYGENWGAPDKVFRRIMSLLGEESFAFAVIFFAFLVGLKVRIGNRFLELMGKITLEFYLIHGLFSEGFSYAFEGKLKPFYYIKNNALYVLVVFLLGLLAAVLFKLCETGLGKLGKKAKQ